jgi:hypothetical protein
LASARGKVRFALVDRRLKSQFCFAVAGYSGNSVGQIRFVPGIGLAIVQFDVDPAWGNHTLFQRKPDFIQVAGFA